MTTERPVCPKCGGKLYVHAKVWSGRNRRIQYQCSKCGSTKLGEKIKEERK